jgi:hypothetical protein
MDTAQLEIEWVILADSAEVLNNKLYLMGGGWENLIANTGFPVAYPCAVAASFLVPWSDEPNRVVNIGIDIADEDGGAVLSQTIGQVDVRRSPFRERGEPDRVQIAIKFGLVLERPGHYVATARVEEREKSARFTVLPGPGLEETQPPPRSVRPRQGRQGRTKEARSTAA